MRRSHRLALCQLLIKVSCWIGSAVFVSYGCGARAAVLLLLKELVTCNGVNISAHFNTISWWSPFELCIWATLVWGLWPTPHSGFILGILVIAYGSSILKKRLRVSSSKIKLFDIPWQSALFSALTNMQLYSVLHPHPHNSFLFDCNTLTCSWYFYFLEAHCLQFWALFIIFHNISLHFTLIEPLWLIMWVSVVAQWCFKNIFLQRVSSFSHLCLGHVSAAFDRAGFNTVQTELQNLAHQIMMHFLRFWNGLHLLKP